MRKIILIVSLFAMLLPAADVSNSALLAGFKDPPRTARVHCYWWWLNGNTDKAAITRDLEQMKANGYGGALLVDANGSDQFGNQMIAAGPMFGSPAWRELYRHAVREADRLGLEISLNIASGWNLGGPTIKPEQASKLLTFSRIPASGDQSLNLALPDPPRQEGFYLDIATLAYPLHHGAALPRPIDRLTEKAAFKEFGWSMPVTKPLLEDAPATPGEEDTHTDQVIDVSRFVNAGRLQWTPPQSGDWEILRMGYTASGAKVSTSSGNWQGLAIDYLDHAALERYWQEQVAPLLADAQPYVGKSLRYLVTDSWELGGANWTARFREEFQRRRGYDLLPYLPIIAGRIVQDRDTSSRFLNDFRKTIGELIADEHYETFARLAAQSGLGIHPESGGPHGAPIDALRTLGKSTFPQTEFWAQSTFHRSTDEDRFFVKEGASAAHIYGKTIVAGEGMTSIGPQWEETIWNDLKPTFDQAVCSGLNMIFWHTFTSSPKSAGLPGQEYFAGTHLNPNVTWWPYAAPFLKYISRIQFLMQQGLPVADVLYYYGDQTPNFVQLQASDPAHILPGYDYDVTDEEVLVNRLSVKDRRLMLPDGMSYRLLVLPDLRTMSLAAITKIRSLQTNGAVIIGPKPSQPTGLHQDIASVASEIWSHCSTCSKSARQELADLSIIPDFTSDSADLDYEHRQTSDSDIYFIRSKSLEPLNTTVNLRVSGLTPDQWDAATGQVTPLYVYRDNGTSTTLPLALGPYGSTVLIFTRNERDHLVPPSPGNLSIAKNGDKWTAQSELPGTYETRTSAGKPVFFHLTAPPPPCILDGPWQVHFAPGWGAPESALFNSLTSWTESENPDIRYFSGTATYTKSFNLPATFADAKAVLLDLGEVRELAQVKLNGTDLGVIWQHPASVPITGLLHAGKNEIAIEVTNLWPNRLIGDQKLPPEKRRTRTNILKFKADSPLIPSGLLGPVEIRTLATN